MKILPMFFGLRDWSMDIIALFKSIVQTKTFNNVQGKLFITVNMIKSVKCSIRMKFLRQGKSSNDQGSINSNILVVTYFKDLLKSYGQVPAQITHFIGTILYQVSQKLSKYWTEMNKHFQKQKFKGFNKYNITATLLSNRRIGGFQLKQNFLTKYNQEPSAETTYFK